VNRRQRGYAKSRGRLARGRGRRGQRRDRQVQASPRGEYGRCRRTEPASDSAVAPSECGRGEPDVAEGVGPKRQRTERSLRGPLSLEGSGPDDFRFGGQRAVAAGDRALAAAILRHRRTQSRSAPSSAKTASVTLIASKSSRRHTTNSDRSHLTKEPTDVAHGPLPGWARRCVGRVSDRSAQEVVLSAPADRVVGENRPVR
jgi:hypothetical protein